MELLLFLFLLVLGPFIAVGLVWAVSQVVSKARRLRSRPKPLEVPAQVEVLRGGKSELEEGRERRAA
jgi:hypothetical protein